MAKNDYKGMSMMDIIEAADKINSLPTKEQFGKDMHDDGIEEEDKIEEARRVAMAGGYECLQD